VTHITCKLERDTPTNTSSCSQGVLLLWQAGQLAQAKLQGHWEMSGDVQQGLRAASNGAEKAAAAAQAARQRAQLLSGRLDAAAILVDDGSRVGNMQLAGHSDE
jgi:hypothetical protein